MRKGFGLITAILFIILVATLGALALSLSSESTKATADAYLKEQAELLAQSATEYALLAISGHENNTSCLQEIRNISYPKDDDANRMFDINISMQYIGRDIQDCPNHILSDVIDTNDSNMTVLIDVFVKSTPLVATETISFHRRTLQKP